MGLLTATAALLRSDDHAIETVTTGGTGTCKRCAAHVGVTEVQPGSFIFLDGAYGDALRGRNPYAHALTVLATVISRPAPGRAVIDAGLKALSTDMGNAEPAGLPGVRYRVGGDEHGILEWKGKPPVPLAMGDQVALIPGHIETTVNLLSCPLRSRQPEMIVSNLVQRGQEAFQQAESRQREHGTALPRRFQRGSGQAVVRARLDRAAMLCFPVLDEDYHSRLYSFWGA